MYTYFTIDRLSCYVGKVFLFDSEVHIFKKRYHFSRLCWLAVWYGLHIIISLRQQYFCYQEYGCFSGGESFLTHNIFQIVLSYEELLKKKGTVRKNCRLLKPRSLGCNTAITSPSRYQLERPIISRSENLILVGSQKLCYMFYRCLFDLLIINFK